MTVKTYKCAIIRWNGLRIWYILENINTVRIYFALLFIIYYQHFCFRIHLHAFLQVASLVPGCDCPCVSEVTLKYHDDVTKCKHFSRFWPFVRGIHRSPVNSPNKGQWRGPLMFSLICAWVTAWVNNREAGDLRRHRDHFDVVVMMSNMAGP